MVEYVMWRLRTGLCREVVLWQRWLCSLCAGTRGDQDG